MPKPGFTRNAKAIANILHNDKGGQEAVDDGAERILAETGDKEAFLSDPFHTDRYVRAVMVPADKQAKYGTGSRAAQSQAK